MTLQSRYTILSKIADGGTAEIFLATQHGAHGFEKPVVLKRIFPAFYADPQFRNMLVDEAHIAMSLSHSNIVQVLDLGEADGQYVLALELVDGWTLDAIFRRARAVNTAIPPALALYLTAEICRALAYAHAKTGPGGKPLGIVHRDISPHNVLLSEQGEVKLTDFGIAKAHNRRESSLGNIIKGKIAYMSPEQASGTALDARSDLFSVGTMLYVMICRRYPFDAPTDLEVLLMVKNGECAPPESARPGLNPEIYRVLKRAMAKAPGDRYQRAEEMLVDVEQVMRVAFRAVGQTELKRWLQDLSVRDGVLPLLRSLSAPAPPPARAPADSQPHRVSGTHPALPPGSRPPPPPPPRRTGFPTPPPLRPIGGSGPTALRPPPPPAALSVGRKSSLTPPPGPIRPLSSDHSTGSPIARESADAAREPPPRHVTRGSESAAPRELPDEDGAATPTPVMEMEAHLDETEAHLDEVLPDEMSEAAADGETDAAPEAVPEAAAPETSLDAPAEHLTAATAETTSPDPSPESAHEPVAEAAPEGAPEGIPPATTDMAPVPQSPRRSSSWVAEAVLAAVERAGAPTPPPPGASPPPPPPPLPSLLSSAPEAPAAPPVPVQPPKPRLRRFALGAAVGVMGLVILLLAVRGLSGGHKQPERTRGSTNASGSTTASQSTSDSTSTLTRKPSAVQPIQVAQAPDASVAVIAEMASPRPTSPERPAVALAASTQHPPAGNTPGAPPDVGGSAPSKSPIATTAPDAGGSPGLAARMPVADNNTAAAAPDDARSEPPGEADPSTESDTRSRGPRPRIPVVLKSWPPGALVGTTHHSFGATPVTVKLKIGGNYSFTFTSEGHRPVTKRFQVTGDPDQEVTATLHKAVAGSTPPTTQGANQPEQTTKARDPNWLQRMFSR